MASPYSKPLGDDDLRVLIAGGRSLTFGDRANRDRAAKLAGSGWSKSSSRNQLLDLHYVDDTGEPDLGLANRNGWFSTLYFLNPPGGQRY